MKNRVIFGLFYIIIGVLFAAGPFTLFKICGMEHHRDAPDICFYMARSVAGNGGLMAALGVLYIFAENGGARVGLAVSNILNIVLVFLFANVIIGVNPMETMPCRYLTLPSLNVISVIAFILTFGNLFYLVKGGNTFGKSAA